MLQDNFATLDGSQLTTENEHQLQQLAIIADFTAKMFAMY